MNFTLKKEKKQWRESMKNAPNIKLKIIDLEEITEPIDISVNLQTKSSLKLMYDSKKPKKTIALF